MSSSAVISVLLSTSMREMDSGVTRPSSEDATVAAAVGGGAVAVASCAASGPA